MGVCANCGDGAGGNAIRPPPALRDDGDGSSSSTNADEPASTATPMRLLDDQRVGLTGKLIGKPARLIRVQRCTSGFSLSRTNHSTGVLRTQDSNWQAHCFLCVVCPDFATSLFLNAVNSPRTVKLEIDSLLGLLSRGVLQLSDPDFLEYPRTAR